MDSLRHPSTHSDLILCVAKGGRYKTVVLDGRMDTCSPYSCVHVLRPRRPTVQPPTHSLVPKVCLHPTPLSSKQCSYFLELAAQQPNSRFRNLTVRGYYVRLFANGMVVSWACTPASVWIHAMIQLHSYIHVHTALVGQCHAFWSCLCACVWLCVCCMLWLLLFV